MALWGFSLFITFLPVVARLDSQVILNVVSPSPFVPLIKAMLNLCDYHYTTEEREYGLITYKLKVCVAV